MLAVFGHLKLTAEVSKANILRLQSQESVLTRPRFHVRALRRMSVRITHSIFNLPTVKLDDME